MTPNVGDLISVEPFYVGRRTHTGYVVPRTLAKVGERMSQGLTALSALIADHGLDAEVIDTEHHDAYKRLVEALHRIVAILPPIHVEYAVVRTTGSVGALHSHVWEACFTLHQAEVLLAAWQAKERKLADRHGWQYDKWTIEPADVEFHDLIDPAATDEQLRERVRKSGAFEP